MNKHLDGKNFKEFEVLPSVQRTGPVTVSWMLTEDMNLLGQRKTCDCSHYNEQHKHQHISPNSTRIVQLAKVTSAEGFIQGEESRTKGLVLFKQKVNLVASNEQASIPQPGPRK